MRTAPLRAALALVLALPACVVYDSDVVTPAPTYANNPPYIDWAEASCGWDGYVRDNVWVFEAGVSDWDGAGDIVAVVADVYDTWDGRWIDGFELAWDPAYGTWYSDWLGSTTYLDCGYPDYVVDFTAFDRFDDADVVSVAPGYF